MQGRALRTTQSATVAALVVLLSACGGGAPAQKPVAAGPYPTTAANQPAAAKAQVTKAEVALRPTGGSAVAGTATLEQAAEKVAYKLTVTGAEAGPHTVYIFAGAVCDTKGNRTGPLNAVEAAADGGGSAEGTLLTQLATLVGRSLALYASDKGDSEIIACGPITAAG